MYQSIIVVDDFLENAQVLRDAALKLDYPKIEERGFPGANSARRLLVEGVDEQVSRILGEPVKPIEPMQSHGRCRLTLEGDVGMADIHVDQSYWSGILYLNRPEDCQGGTDFFRHIPTNSDRVAMNDDELKQMGYSSHQEMHREIISKQGKDRSKWEHIMRVPMRFNRLVLLRPWLWHSAGPGFGQKVDNGRLVYLMFFGPRK